MDQDNDSRPFPDGPSVYHQLRWDPRFDADACEIVLVDRPNGTKVIAFRDFLPNGPIPWHRIVGFRYRGAPLWDRALRLDRRADVLGHSAAHPASTVAPQPLPSRALEPRGAATGALSPAPTVATWNVLSNRFEGELLDHPTRWRALLDTVAEAAPELIAFTEATDDFVAVLEAHGLAAGRALVRSPHGDVVLLCAATPLACEALECAPGREVVVAHFDGLTFAGLHLPSDREQDRRAERERDLSRLCHTLLSSNALVLAGDFNAQPDELAPLLGRLHGVDAWQTVNPASAGLTYDVERNPLAAALTSRGRSGRLDRIVCFGERLRAKSARLLGDDSVHRSDHFGLFVQLEDSTAPQLSHRTALALLPPEAHWGPIQRLRRTHDRRFDRWPPHVTLLFGFVEPDLLEAQVTELQAALRAIPSRMLRFDQVIVFEHAQSFTVALGPDEPSRRWLEALQAALVARWPACTEQNRGEHGEFVPHLTLGAVGRDDPTALELLRREARRLTLEWEPTDVALLERPDDTFFVRARVAFRDGLVRRPAAGAAPMDALEQRVRAAITSAASTAGIEVSVRAFGSRAWAPSQPGTDLDLLVVCETSPGAFLDLVATELDGTRVGRHLVRGAGFDVVAIDRHDEDDEARRFALGADDAKVLRATLAQHGRTAAFDAVFAGVRRWARRRGLEGNAFGYFGGLGWAVLVASPLLHDAGLCALDGDEALAAWRTWARRLDGTSAVRLGGVTREGQGFTIMTPAHPERPITRALIPSTERVLLDELRAQRDDDVIEVAAWLRVSGPTHHLGAWQQRALGLYSGLEREFGPVLRPFGLLDATGPRFVSRLGLRAPIASQVQPALTERLQRAGLVGVTVTVEG
ncbi:MAG: RNA repair domain-containing protein [Myxococcaceae bacterium]|jgi:poly(A) polymerase|nr:RNA repair domain-containing protein [Myxococcaceae bacterium]